MGPPEGAAHVAGTSGGPRGIAAPVTEAAAIRVGPEHAARLAEFFRAVWDPEATEQGVLEARQRSAAENPVTPGAPTPSFAFLLDGRIVGYMTTIPALLWEDGCVRPVHWTKGLMVLPEFRNGPIGFMLLKEAIRHLPSAMAIVVAPPARRLFEGIGFVELGVIPNFVRVTRPVSFLRKLRIEGLGLEGIPSWAPTAFNFVRSAGLTPAAAAPLSALDLLVAARTWRSRQLQVTAERPDASEIDALWLSARAHYRASLVRDARYLLSRYADAGTYSFVSVRAGRTLRALAVVRRPSETGDPRLHGIRVATLVDLIADLSDDRSALAAIRVVDPVARSLGADAILCSATSQALTPLLTACGYRGVGGNLRFLVRDEHDRATKTPLGGWHLMRGDSGADEVL